MRFHSAVFALLLCLASSWCSAESPTVSSAVTAPITALSIFDTLHLSDQNGHPVSSTEFRGKLVLLNFIFTGCTTSCPMQTQELAAVQRNLPAQVRSRILIVSVSVDPSNDKPSVLKDYASSFHVDQKNWLFVTGQPDRIEQLTRHFDSFAPAAGSPRAARHTTDLRLFDAQGKFLQRYTGVPVDQDRLGRELSQLADLHG